MMRAPRQAPSSEEHLPAPDGLDESVAEQDVLAQDPLQISRRAHGAGQDRLDRSALDILLTSLIGGLEVSLGGLAAMSVVGGALASAPGIDFYGALALGGLAFPIGLMFVVLGRSELFTENFLIPVVAVVKGDRTFASLLKLWSVSWVGNVAACIAMAALVSVPEAVGAPIREAYRSYAAYKLALPWTAVLASAVLAGMTMTALTWLLLSVRHAVARFLSIFAGGYLLFAANLSHSLVGGSLIFAGFAPAGYTVLDVAVWLLLATTGNIVGGVGLVTLFRVAQAKEQAG